MSKLVPVLVVIAVLLITAGAVYYGMRQASAPASEDTTTPKPPEQAGVPGLPKNVEPPKAQTPTGISVENAAIEQRDPQGRLEWKIDAGGQLEFDKDRQTVTGQDVRFEMLQKDKLPCVINAPVFKADYAARKIVFERGVSGHMTQDGAHFQVNHLVYNFDTQKLVGTGGARFVQGGYSARAQEIVLDAKAKKVRLRGGVRFERRG